MDTAAVQCWRPDISFSTERLSWLVSRMASSDHQEYQESANRNYQTLSNFEQLLRENLKSCDNYDFQHHSMLWHHFLRHSRVRRSPWAWPREHVCLGRGPMASIVTMCHVSCIHTLCVDSDMHQLPTKQKNKKKTTHILCLKWCLDAMYWSLCGGSMGFHGIPTWHPYIQYATMHILFECTFLCTLILCAQYTNKGGETCNYTEKQCNAPQLPLQVTPRGGTGCPCARCFISTCWSRPSTALWVMTRLYSHCRLADCNW